MPPQQRRRRRTTNQQQRPARTSSAPARTSSAPARTSSAPARTSSAPARTSRRERVVEKVDYTQDYDSVRRDLKRIAFWSFWLFLGMFAWYFVA